MKRLLAIVALSFIVLSTVKAEPPLTDVVYPTSLAFTSDYATYLNLSGANTNSVSPTNRVDGNLYHTFHFVSQTNLNGLSYVIDRSLDSTNFYAGATNSVGTNAVAEATITGKEGYFRVRIFGTNVLGSVNYLGGR